ncbi:contractile injection system tape measure protein [Thiocapsa marina]|uniref:contractile injection system tape measure protein n=1 Tax=Thiocapsa marina TaxID=244573 RepID=UPI0022773580|nr:contractile injection system tape measure protein [Thiocapsa marina]
MAAHVIRALRLDLTVPRQANDFDLDELLNRFDARWFEQRLSPILDAVSPGDRRVKAHTLVLDLGAISLGALEARLAAALDDHLQGAIRQQLTQASNVAAGESAGEAASDVSARLSQLRCLLIDGARPWSLESGIKDTDALLELLIHSAPKELLEALKRWSKEPVLVPRLTAACSEARLRELLGLLGRDRGEAIIDAVDSLVALQRSQGLIGLPAATVERELWSAAFGVVLSGPGLVATGEPGQAVFARFADRIGLATNALREAVRSKPAPSQSSGSDDRGSPGREIPVDDLDALRLILVEGRISQSHLSLVLNQFDQWFGALLEGRRAFLLALLRQLRHRPWTIGRLSRYLDGALAERLVTALEPSYAGLLISLLLAVRRLEERGMLGVGAAKLALQVVLLQLLAPRGGVDARLLLELAVASLALRLGVTEAALARLLAAHATRWAETEARFSVLAELLHALVDQGEETQQEETADSTASAPVVEARGLAGTTTRAALLTAIRRYLYSGEVVPPYRDAYELLSRFAATQRGTATDLSGKMSLAVDVLARIAATADLDRAQSNDLLAQLLDLDVVARDSDLKALIVEVQTRIRAARPLAATRPGTSQSAAHQVPEAGNDTEEHWFVQNAGQVLLHPFLPRFFGALELLDGDRFKTPEHACRGVHLLQYLVDANSHSREPDLLLNKILCGLQPRFPVLEGITLRSEEIELSRELLGVGVVGNWKALKNTSEDGLREAFLRRPGRLSRRDDQDWSLAVSRKTLDILLDRCPWSVSVIRLPWMQQTLYTSWR